MADETGSISMSNSPDDSGSRDPLEPVLADVEAELRRRLREACEAEASGISSDATSEIRRLEDLDCSARRPLPQQPAEWMQLSEPELVQLVDQAISAPERRGGTESATRSPAPPAN